MVISTVNEFVTIAHRNTFSEISLRFERTSLFQSDKVRLEVKVVDREWCIQQLREDWVAIAKTFGTEDLSNILSIVN